MIEKEALLKIIRSQADSTAKEIVSAVMGGFREFIRPLPQKDDATLVVIKVES
jgi:serine phosphatase RsbU (regulator of sigma subunit)